MWLVFALISGAFYTAQGLITRNILRETKMLGLSFLFQRGWRPRKLTVYACKYKNRNTDCPMGIDDSSRMFSCSSEFLEF